MEKIVIRESSDWKKQLVDNALNIVVDPMVFRSGELFLKGAGGVETLESIWSLPSANLHAIGLFFDCLILNEKMPVFNYGDTFDMQLNFDQRDLLESSNERELVAFLFGALIFGGYAQQMESEHVLQPKRSRILLALALHAKSTGHRFADALFAELRSKANTPSEDLPWQPTFFPYLLAKANTPMEVLQEVVNLRQSELVAEYRQWLQEAIQDWKKNGRIRVEKRKDIRKIAQNTDRMLGTIPSMPKVEVRVTVVDAIAQKSPGGVDLTPVLQRLWGWFLDALPGNRYRKLLTRAIVEDNQYVLLENRVKAVWNEG